MENKTQKTATFMMGVPAAGKSTIASKEFSDVKILDCDKIKETHPDYDPKNPSLVHAWSTGMLEKEFQKTLFEDESFVIDGTGANSDKMSRQITEAKSAGFKTRLVYVIVCLKTSLKRNSERIRVVPEEIVIAKYKDIRYSFDLVSPQVDEVEVIKNE